MWSNFARLSQSISFAGENRNVDPSNLNWWGVEEANHFASYSLLTQVVCDALMESIRLNCARVPVEDL